MSDIISHHAALKMMSSDGVNIHALEGLRKNKAPAVCFLQHLFVLLCFYFVFFLFLQLHIKIHDLIYISGGSCEITSHFGNDPNQVLRRVLSYWETKHR